MHSKKEDQSTESDTSPSLSLHCKKEEVASTDSDTSKHSQGYLSPLVKKVEETKSDSQEASYYEEFQDITKCTGNFIQPFQGSSLEHWP